MPGLFAGVAEFLTVTLNNECALLEEYRVDDFHGLLSEAYLSLSGLIEMMKNTNQEARLDGCTVLGCQLESTTDLLFKIQDAHSAMELVEA